MQIPQLFSEPVKDTDTRITRLEGAVQSLRSDFDTVMPAMVRMVTMEDSMRELIDQMKTLNDTAHPATPAAVTPAGKDAVPAKAAAEPVAAATPPAKTPDKPAAADKAVPAESAPPPAAPAAAVTAAPSEPALGKVQDLRVGEHGTTTRIVLDMSAKAAIRAVVAQDGKQLVVDLPRLDWTGKSSGSEKSNPLVSGYRYDAGKLIIDLRHAAVIKTQQVMAPGGGSADYRLVIDIAGAVSAPAAATTSPAATALPEPVPAPSAPSSTSPPVDATEAPPPAAPAAPTANPTPGIVPGPAPVASPTTVPTGG